MERGEMADRGFHLREIHLESEDLNLCYLRPEQVREIPLKAGSIRGYIPSLKPTTKGKIWSYESQLERDFYYLLDHDPNCVDFQPQPCQILYKSANGKDVRIIPDAWAIFRDGSQYLFEVKFRNELDILKAQSEWIRKVAAINEYLKKMGLCWEYRAVTEEQIRGIRLNNIKDMLCAAKHYTRGIDRHIFDDMESMVDKTARSEKIKFEDLVNKMAGRFGIKKADIISFLKKQIYFGHLKIDWDEPFDDAFVSLDDTISLKPIHQLIPPLDMVLDSIKKKQDVSMDDINIDWLDEEYGKRMGVIEPIIQKLGNSGKKGEIREFCQENSIPFYAAYRWYLKWRECGNNGLFPKPKPERRKSRIKNLKAADLLEQMIVDWVEGDWQSCEYAYKKYVVECQKLRIPKDEIPSNVTFRNWVKRLPNSEQHGKFRPRTQKYIKKGITGSYREGRYPGAVIQMDHTQADILLVDSFTKKPLGRPWITMGVDVFSRNIWGYFISFDEPNQESVLNAILSGFIKKSETKEWDELKIEMEKRGLDVSQYDMPCAGFPALIQVDNGKYFQAHNVKEFLISQNITFEFRPIYTPNYAGHIEAPWDTFNDAIRGSLLPGRIYPIPKNRDKASSRKIVAPPRYNPADEASMTIDDFKRWFFTYIVTVYCFKNKAKQTNSPNFVWLQGLSGENFQPLGGQLRIAESDEFALLEFYCKRKKAANLSEKGIRYNNVYYTSPWLVEARKHNILKDQERYEFRISTTDIRYIYLLDPSTRRVEKLTAYNYDGDSRLLKFILRGTGAESGYKEFLISEKMFKFAKDQIEGHYPEDGGNLLILDGISEKMKGKVKINKKEQVLLENLAKSDEGRKTMVQVVKEIQLDKENRINQEKLEEIEFERDLKQNLLKDEEDIQGFKTDVNKSKKTW
jgi:putative transposase